MRASAIRRVVATALTDIDLVESRWVYERFGSEPQTTVHRTFATRLSAISDAPQPRGQSRRMTAALEVQIAARVRADAQVSDMDEALDLAEDAGEALTRVDRTAGLHIRPVRTDIRVVGDGTFAVIGMVYEVQYINKYQG